MFVEHGPLFYTLWRNDEKYYWNFGRRDNRAEIWRIPPVVLACAAPMTGEYDAGDCVRRGTLFAT